MLKFYQEWQSFVCKTHFVRILHLWFQKLASAFIASFCIFLQHTLPLGTTRGFGCQEVFPVSCRSVSQQWYY